MNNSPLFGGSTTPDMSLPNTESANGPHSQPHASQPYRTTIPMDLQRKYADQSRLNVVRETVERKPLAALGVAALSGCAAALVAFRPRKEEQESHVAPAESFDGASCPVRMWEEPDVEPDVAGHRDDDGAKHPDEVHAEAVKEHLEENEPSWVSELAMSALSATLASFTANKRSSNQRMGLWSAISRGQASPAPKPRAVSRTTQAQIKNQSSTPISEPKFPRPKHDRSRTAPKSPWLLIKTTVSDFIEDKAPRLAAALAYYTVFSIAPLLLITVAVLSQFVGGDAAATAQIQTRIEPFLGKAASDAILAMLQGAKRAGGGLIPTLIGVGVLIFGASGVFAQMKDALDTIWEVEPKPGRGILATVMDRALSFLLVLVIGLLLLSSMFVSTAINFMSEHTSDILPIPSTVIHLLNIGISAVIVTLLFGIIFKYLPDVEIGWRDVMVGAVVTAMLFLVGNYAIGMYISKAAVGSAYGPASSIIIVLLWANYSAMIFLLGAEFTQAYAMMYGSQIQPAPDAVLVEKRQ